MERKRMDLERGIEWASNIYYLFFLPWIAQEILKPGQFWLPLSPQYLELGLTSYQVLRSLLSESTNQHFIWASLRCLPPWHCLHTSCLPNVSSSCTTTNANVCKLPTECKWLENPVISGHTTGYRKAASMSKSCLNRRWPKMQREPLKTKVFIVEWEVCLVQKL